MAPERLFAALIVDDEPVARDRIRSAVARVPNWRVAGECRNGVEAVTAIEELDPDLVILDIRMPGLDGFGVIERVGPHRMPPVLFVTAHHDHAVRAFEVHALDYVVKPFTDARLHQAVARAERSLLSDRQQELARRFTQLLEEIRQPAGGTFRRGAAGFATRLSVPNEGGLVLLAVTDIDYVEAARNYARLHVGSRAYLLRTTLTRLAERLDPAQFVRIHRSLVVNLAKVREVRPWQPDGHVAVLSGGAKLRIGRQYRDQLLERLA